MTVIFREKGHTYETLDENPDLYQVVLHMKSGKKFTRRVYRKQFEELIEEFEGEEE